MPSRLTVVLVSLMLATPAVIFWLWLVIEPARVAILCPEKCRCDPLGYYVSCVNTSLTAVPLIRFTAVRELWLHGSNITLFERGNFFSRGLTELEILNVWRCGLRTIELGAFNGLRKLTHLSIADNEISEIIPGTFVNMSNLQYLDLEYNRLEHLDSAVFSGLVKLNYIGLGRNKLQDLHPDTFLGLPNLQSLHLGANSGLQIPTDSNFINSPSLSFLNISGCNVNSVSVGTFVNVSALEWLDLSYNNLRTVDINILRALPELFIMSLYGNPLQCDCQLQEVWRWYQDRNIRTGYRGKVPECHTPSEVKGMWWGVLEKGQCVQDNIQYYEDYKNASYSFTNIECEYWEEYVFELVEKYEVPVYAFPFIFGTTGNVIILIIIICNKDIRTVPYMYMLNLAISDIIYLTVLFSESCAYKISDTWLRGEFMCLFIPFCRRLSVGLSGYSVAVLSNHRSRVTVNPFQVRVSSTPTWRDIVTTICEVWIVAALFAVPSALSQYLCLNVILGSATYYQRLVIFELLLSCVFPLCVIAFTYIMTARHLVESSRSISEGTQNPQLNTRSNTAKIAVGLTIVFMISYVPYHVLWPYVICNEENDFYWRKLIKIPFSSNYVLHYTYLISTCLLLINSCLNPVALFCTSSPFRQHLKRYLTCCCKTISPPTDLELTRRN